jgi:hypothetical protein
MRLESNKTASDGMMLRLRSGGSATLSVTGRCQLGGGDGDTLEPPPSRRCSILLIFEKLMNWDTRESTTPPSPIMLGGVGLGPDSAIPR